LINKKNKRLKTLQHQLQFHQQQKQKVWNLIASITISLETKKKKEKRPKTPQHQRG
jgi:mannose/fructose/N-acetylgalactosamine-specific phosphotransferase system component IID